MDLAEARVALRTFADGGYPVGTRAAVSAVLARLDEIETRARQVRGGLKPYARPVEVVDFLLAEPD